MRRILSPLLGMVFLVSSLFAGEPGVSAETEKPLLHLVAFDFESAFDKGELGGKVARMFRAKARRRGLFSVDTEIDWEDLARLVDPPALGADPATVAEAVREKLGARVAVWGRIERPQAPGPDVVVQHKGYKTRQRSDKGLELLLHVRAVDVERPGEFAVFETFRCGIDFDLSGRVDEVLKLLTGEPTPADVEAAHAKRRMVPVGENLCAHGDFEVFEGPPDEDWMRALPGWHFPMKGGILPSVTEVTLGGEREGEYKIGTTLHYTLSKQIAATTGLFCYTPYIPVEPGTYYQVSFRVKTAGPKVICFVKGYRDMPVEGYEGVTAHRQEVYKHQKRFYGERNAWETLVTEPFLPRSAKKEHMPQFIRVQLYAYWPPGEVYFDDVSVRACEERGGDE